MLHDKLQSKTASYKRDSLLYNFQNIYVKMAIAKWNCNTLAPPRAEVLICSRKQPKFENEKGAYNYLS